MNSVSVIICTWNRSGSLRTTLLSLQDQEVSPDTVVDVVVVDNNSKDDTAAEVERLRSSWGLGTLRYVFEGRQGKQFALNTGIAASAGNVLAFTDDDILFPQGWLAAVQDAFVDGRVELAGGRTHLAWPEGGAPQWYAAGMAAILGGVDLGPAPLIPPPEGYAPAGANLVARRSLFAKVGPFSEAHFRHMDYEFGLRCRQAKVCVAYDPALEVMAPVDPQMLSKRYFRRWSFKAGISGPEERFGNARMLFGVPLWIYRQLAENMFRYPADLLFASPGEAFTRELHILRNAGTIASRWYFLLWPERYAGWVEKYSQKKKNVY